MVFKYDYYVASVSSFSGKINWQIRKSKLRKRCFEKYSGAK